MGGQLSRGGCSFKIINRPDGCFVMGEAAKQERHLSGLYDPPAVEAHRSPAEQIRGGGRRVGFTTDIVGEVRAV